MHEGRRRWLKAAGCLALAPAVRAQSALPDPVEALHDRATQLFWLPDDTGLDDDLRAQATALANEHLARVRDIVAGWVGAEKTRDPAAREPAVFWRCFARLANASALLHVGSDDPQENALVLRALAAPQLCATMPAAGFMPFAWRCRQLQMLPVAERPAGWDLLRRALARWGDGSTRPPPRPPASEAAALQRTVLALRDAGVRPARPLPPVVAFRVLGPQGTTGLRIDVRTALHQWWALQRGPEALAGFRYAALPPVGVLMQVNLPTEPGAGGYPDVARRFEVEGRVIVEVGTVGAPPAGSAQVVERRIKVPGLAGQVPIAFDAVFDEASVDRALREASRPGRMELVWRLE